MAIHHLTHGTVDITAARARTLSDKPCDTPGSNGLRYADVMRIFQHFDLHIDYALIASNAARARREHELRTHLNNGGSAILNVDNDDIPRGINQFPSFHEGHAVWVVKPDGVTDVRKGGVEWHDPGDDSGIRRPWQGVIGTWLSPESRWRGKAGFIAAPLPAEDPEMTTIMQIETHGPRAFTIVQGTHYRVFTIRDGQLQATDPTEAESDLVRTSYADVLVTELPEHANDGRYLMIRTGPLEDQRFIRAHKATNLQPATEAVTAATALAVKEATDELKNDLAERLDAVWETFHELQALVDA